MNTNTTLTIKLPKELRDEAKRTAAVVGLPLSTVIHRQLRDFVQQQEITFSAPVEMGLIREEQLSKDAKQKLRRARLTTDKKFVNL